MIEFGTWPPTIIGLFSEPLGANFDSTAAGLAAARPVGPFTKFAVRWTGDDAGLFNISFIRELKKKFVSQYKFKERLNLQITFYNQFYFNPLNGSSVVELCYIRKFEVTDLSYLYRNQIT